MLGFIKQIKIVAQKIFTCLEPQDNFLDSRSRKVGPLLAHYLEIEDYSDEIASTSLDSRGEISDCSGLIPIWKMTRCPSSDGDSTARRFG